MQLSIAIIVSMRTVQFSAFDKIWEIKKRSFGFVNKYCTE